MFILFYVIFGRRGRGRGRRIKSIIFFGISMEE